MPPSPPPIRRPDTARPRADPPPAPDAVPVAPTSRELERIEQQLTELAGLAGATVSDEPDLGSWLVTWKGRGPALNHAERVRWPADDAGIAGRIERLTARLEQTGDRPAVAIAEDLTQPTGLGARLAGLGWRPVLHELVLGTRRAAIVPHLDPSTRIEAVTLASSAAYEATERVIFDLDGSLADVRLAAMRRAIGAGRLRAYLVRVADEPIATARLWTFGDLACLDGLGVVPQARRRGYGTLVATVATRAALATGHGLVWLEVAADNAAARAMYARLGYDQVLEWRLYVV
jgi:ribosomal protein S18 acetylase RimI-like enzyme